MGLTSALLAVSVGGQVVNSIQKADAAGEAKKQLAQQTTEEQDLINQTKAKAAEENKTAGKIKTRNAQETTGQSKAFDNTIFSGPLGLPVTPKNGVKTLLGE